MEPFTMMAIMIGIRAVKWLADNVDSVVSTIELAWETVHDWLRARRVSTGDVGTLVKQSLAGGRYKVIGGVLDARGQIRQGATAWECDSLDSALCQKLAGKSEIRITL